MPTLVPAAERTCAVLELLADSGHPVPVAVIARELGIPRSSVYQLLDVLAEREFVMKLTAGWVLGLRTFEIGSAYVRTSDVEQIAAPLLRHLVEQAPVPVVAHVGVLVGHEIVYLVKESTNQSITTITKVGVRLPAALTASGRAILMHLTKDQVRATMSARGAFIDRTGRGPQSLSSLQSMLTQERHRGYAEEDGFITEGYASVACAVLDPHLRPTAAVGLTFDAGVSAAVRSRLARGVARCASDLQMRVFAPMAHPDVKGFHHG